jgi:hypothetical protein
MGGLFALLNYPTHPPPPPPQSFWQLSISFSCARGLDVEKGSRDHHHTLSDAKEKRVFSLWVCARAPVRFFVLTKSFPSRRTRTERCSEVRARTEREERDAENVVFQVHSVNKLGRGLDVVVFFCCRFFFFIVLLSSLQLFQPCRTVSFCTTCRRRSPCLIRWLLF